MKFIYFLILILSLHACYSPQPKVEPYQRSEHSKIAERITAKTAQKIESETGLRLMGVGGGMMDQVNMMAMSFQQLGEITLEQGRELVVYCVNEYLQAINENEEIRPYLVHYPFTPKDIEIRIFIYQKDRSSVSVGALCVASTMDGIVDFDIKQPGTPSLKQFHKETYEEAIKIVEEQGSIEKTHRNANQGLTEEVSQTKRSEQTIVAEVVAKDGAKVNIKGESQGDLTKIF